MALLQIGEQKEIIVNRLLLQLICILFFFNSFLFAQSSLPKCQGTDHTKFNNCHGEHIYLDGKFSENIHPKFLEGPNKGIKVVGPWKNGKPHGKVTIYYPDGSRLESETENEKTFGRASMYNKDNRLFFEGSVQDNEFHGFGTFIWTSGNKYSGQWKNDRKHGKGTYTYPNGSRLEGNWFNDKREGEFFLYNTKGEIDKIIYKDDKEVKSERIK